MFRRPSAHPERLEVVDGQDFGQWYRRLAQANVVEQTVDTGQYQGSSRKEDL